MRNENLKLIQVKGGKQTMARDHTEKPQQAKKEEGPIYLEREVTLSLVNQKLNEALGLLYKIAEELKIKTPVDEE